ncbi:hypothetical protein BAE44_0009169 [Dichanthelium oligosanthes]|uniref:F-box domain-containing protein n=1 Tax=Dichanthelium oligosanthes TaxID=888268 RepID=A0A1E5VXH3_9POAL|nr:hypothetical protein BAE44_0009169 [Dichanthelium oligosanthes]
MTASGSGTSLSDLSDDLLRHVLFFAPAFDGAATAALARRWRTLWRSSGAVNLHWRCDGGDDGWKERMDFLRRAESALAAAHAEGTVRRLTFHVVADSDHQTQSFLSRRGDLNVIDSVLSNPAARRVEELSVKVHIYGYTNGINKFGGIYELGNGTLPSEALRVLHITNCSNLGLCSPGAAFPWLSSVRLQGCTVLLGRLQSMIDTARQLATLHLEWSFLAGSMEVSERTQDYWSLATCVGVECYQLRCPAVTELVLANCKWPGKVQGGMELDVPRLRYFRYTGYIGLVSLKSHAANLARADLHFIDEFHREEYKMGNKMCESFWQFLQNFNDAKVLKVKLSYPIEQIAVAEMNDLDELLGCKLLWNLERLEVEAWHMPRPLGKDTAVAIANLLHCCPVIHDLRLMLTTTTSRIPVIPFDEEDDDSTYKVSEISELRKYSFNCLQNCLRRVRLQFQLEYVNCFQVQLAKFLAENALVLEEMYIEDRNYKVREYINRRVRRWISDASKRRNSSSVAAFAL